jgi:predicted DNA-binding protein
VRGFRDLKARLDRMEARSGGDFHAYNSFEAVSRKLAEMEKAQEATRRVGRGDTFRACLLAAAMLVAAGIIGASLMLSGGSI